MLIVISFLVLGIPDRSHAFEDLPLAAKASSFFDQTDKQESRGRREFYFSWGYNREWYATRSDFYINQPSLGNNFALNNLRAHDDPEFGMIFKRPFVPQYSLRAGYFVKPDLALEFSYDHAKYTVTENQTVYLAGQLGGQWHQGPVLAKDILSYKLNNGANFLLLNVVKRLSVVGQPGENMSLAVLIRGGFGVVLPHAWNKVLGRHNKDGFQFGGWDAGMGAALRWTIFKPVFLELENKFLHAHYVDIRVHEGRANHDVGAYVLNLNLGAAVAKKR
ncbi:MAG: hypothetical protein HY401_01510 [Elusimicrobia bacterium]|nr:hypothetical protein [Elusimicrobiota bacterium]